MVVCLQQRDHICIQSRVNWLGNIVSDFYLSWINSDISFCICLPFSCFCRGTSKPATEVVPWGSFLSVWGKRRPSGKHNRGPSGAVASFVRMSGSRWVRNFVKWMCDSHSHVKEGMCLVCVHQSAMCVFCVCVFCVCGVCSTLSGLWCEWNRGARFIQDSRSDAGNVTSSMTGRKQNSSKGRWQEETGVGFHSIQTGLEPMETENYRRNADMFVGRQSIVPQRTSAYWNWILSFVERWEK